MLTHVCLFFHLSIYLYLCSLKKRKGDGGKYNFMERLLGAARLLSEVCSLFSSFLLYPVSSFFTFDCFFSSYISLNGGTDVEGSYVSFISCEISTLLARSFFMGFSLTILALLARLRVLVQQTLLDVVSVFNMVSSLSQKEQSVKLTQAGIEFFREYYPTNEEFVTLECVWEADKFVLLERIKKIKMKNLDGDPREDVSLGTSTIQYQSIEALLAAALTSGFLLLLCILVLLFLLPSSVTFVFCVDDELGSKKTDMLHSSEEGPTLVSEDKSLLVNPSLESDDGKRVEDSVQVSNGSEVEGSSIENLLPEQGLLPHTSSFPSSNPLKRKFDSSNKVAFVSVKRPTVSAATTPFFPVEEIKSDNENKEDPFFSLLTGGNIKDSIF
ncbi:hypothetical protein CK203_011226 [Vitis vinifera]|uniref:Uncharacterized protein n=1 Tax=Vitis vinifera TaxID=29760 RepID=A0A438JZ21_VITVI|nr:hypothetical protein CK203_011226 [Vitis vinifera]